MADIPISKMVVPGSNDVLVLKDSSAANKVSSPTSGNLASLDGSGNLADSGWKSDKTTTAVSGNPVSISGLKSNQLAKDPIITLEPIQAGSGDPSPSNVRAISGYDKIEVLSCGKNLFPEDKLANVMYDINGDKSFFGNAIGTNGFILVKSSTTYYCSISAYSRDANCRIFWYDKSFNTISYDTPNIFNKTCTSPTNAKYATIYWEQSDNPAVYRNDFIFCENSLTDKSYEPYNKTTDLSLQIGQTIYGGTLDVETGVLTVDRGYIHASDMEWVNQSGNLYYSYGIASLADFNPSIDKWVCSNLKLGDPVSGNISFMFDGTFGVVYVNAGGTLTSEILADMYFVYPLATPLTIQLTPHEISLLKDYAYVSTNGTSISLDYHNGELASLSDVSQLGQTVNELGDIINSKSIKYREWTATTDNDGLVTLGMPISDYPNIICVRDKTPTNRHIFLPFVFDTVWHARVLTYNGIVEQQTSVTMIIAYAL